MEFQFLQILKLGRKKKRLNNEDSVILEELRKISKILLLAFSSAIEKEIAKIATTEKRKAMWVLIDGKRSVEEIAKMIKVTPEAVRKFLREASAADLVKYVRRKPPCRLLDYVPPSWLEYVELPEIEEEE